MSPNLRLLILLSAATGVGPFSMQVITPALPDIAAGLDVSSAAAQLMISMALAGTAVATIVLGTLSDLYGRRPVLVWSLAAATLGSIVVALAPGIGLAVAGRFAQAAGAAAGLVVARAVATDLYGREGAGTFIARMTAIMVLMPTVAPAIGGELVGTIGWRGLFVLILIVAALLTAIAYRAMPETLPVRQERAGLVWLASGLAFAARSPAFRAETLYSSFQLAAFFVFVGAAPFVMREAYGFGPEIYGRYFILVSLCFIAGNLLGARFARSLGGARLHYLGSAISAGLGGLVLAAVAAGLLAGPFALFLPACVVAAGTGLALPHAVAAAVAARAERAGAASSLIGFVQFTMAGIAAQFAGSLDHSNALPTIALLWALSLAAFLLWLLARRWRA